MTAAQLSRTPARFLEVRFLDASAMCLQNCIGGAFQWILKIFSNVLQFSLDLLETLKQQIIGSVRGSSRAGILQLVEKLEDAILDPGAVVVPLLYECVAFVPDRLLNSRREFVLNAIAKTIDQVPAGNIDLLNVRPQGLELCVKQGRRDTRLLARGTR